METDRYISFYAICQELFKEEGREDGPGSYFEHYYKSKRAYFHEILSAMGIESELLKRTDSSGFQLPADRKEDVKYLLKNYTTKTMRKLRKGDFRGMTVEEMKDFTKRIEGILLDVQELDTAHFHIGVIRFRTRQTVREKMDEVTESPLNKIVSDVDSMQEILSEFMLSDEDKWYLLEYLRVLLEAVHDQWRQVGTIVGEIRLEQIMEKSDRDIVALSKAEEGIPDESLQSGYVVINQAIKRYREEKEEAYKRKLRQESDNAENKAVQEFLEKKRASLE